MAFAKKTWKKRLSEYPTRRQLTYTDGTTALVDVARAEGTVSQEGDAFSETNMNDLEQRIADEFAAVNSLMLTQLWKNTAYPTVVTFEAQSITLATTNYDYYIVFFRAGDNIIDSGMSLKGSGIHLSQPSFASGVAYNFCRDIVYVSDTKLNVKAGYRSTGAEYNGACTPVAIYGGKFA